MLNGFDNIVCLNLPSRPDRKERAKKEFEKQGIEVKFFNAVKGGVPGFCQSMYNIFQEHEGSIFVFEDDVKFIADAKLIDIAFNELPDNWDLFYLGANVREPLKRYSTHLQILNNAWTTHAVGYSKNVADYIRREWDGKYRNPFVFDEWLRRIVQPHFNCFITDPMICTQYHDYSDIWKRNTNYDIIQQSQRFYEAIS